MCEDSVVDYFRIIISKCKKFAKPELKACIEEFEEKLNKINMERKEQETTARNAQVHQQKLGTLEVFMTNSKGVAENGANVTSAEDGSSEVVNPINEGENVISGVSFSQVNDTQSEESCMSSIMEKSEADTTEFQSPSMTK